MFRIEAAILGNLPKYMQRKAHAAAVAVTGAVRQVTGDCKNDLKQQIVAAGLGNKLAHTWQARTYPSRGVSIKAAGIVYPDSPKVIRAFTEGVTIRGKHGTYLAIPTENAPKRGIGGGRISPENFPIYSYGPLRFVYRPRGVSLLVVDNLRSGKTGKFRKATDAALRKGRGLTTVVMFYLVPQVTPRKRLDVQAVADRRQAQIGQAVLDHWPQEDDDAE